MRNSDLFSPSTSSPSSSIAFAILAVVASASTASASPVPTPVPPKRQPQFLDFLYPTWYTNQNQALSSSSKRRTKPSRSSTTPGSSRPAAAVEAAPGVRGTFDTQYLQQPQFQQSPSSQPLQRQRQQLQRQRRSLLPTPKPPLAKRATANGRPVPVKYESQDPAGGWVIADTWDLHGHHRRADTSSPNTNTSPSDSLPVQNLDTTGPSSDNALDPNVSVNTTADNLDLPFGWDSGGLNPRHESYDPVIVAVFAVILVLSIVATIGLCRWRARKLKRLRDLERLEREKEGNETGDDESDRSSRISEKENGKKRKKVTSASSSAIRKRFARFRRRHRTRRNGGATEDKTSDGEEPGRNDGHDRADDDRLENSSVTSITSGTTALSRSSTSHRSRSSASTLGDTASVNDVAIPIDSTDPLSPTTQNEPSIGGAAGSEHDAGRTRERGRGRRERPRITISGSEVTPLPIPTPTTLSIPTSTTTIPMPMPIPTLTVDGIEEPSAEPPAYPASANANNATTNANTNASNGSTRRARRTRTPLETSPIPEKAPIPGLEAEYDERDLATNTYSRLGSSNSGLFNSRLSTSGTGLSVRTSAPPTRRPSRVRFVDDAGAGAGATDAVVDAAVNAEDALEDEQVPSFEPFASSLAGTTPGALGGASRVAGGAVLRAHVATDDKGLLERLRELSDEPSLDSAGISASAPPPPPLHPPGVEHQDDPDNLNLVVGDAGSVTLAPAAPSFNEVEQWEFERQMALANGSESPTILAAFITPSSSDPESSSAAARASGSSTRRTVVSNNGFPALPAPPLPVSSLGGGASGEVGYGLGTVWNNLNVGAGAGVPSMPPGSSTNGKARVPSAPPLDIPALRPSAPPPMLDEEMSASAAVIASAPPDWEVDEPVSPQSQEGHVPDAHAPGADEDSITDLSNADPIPDNEGDAGSDGDGAESITSTPPEVNSRWSATFRTRAEEGAGLPRYEP